MTQTGQFGTLKGLAKALNVPNCPFCVIGTCLFFSEAEGAS